MQQHRVPAAQDGLVSLAAGQHVASQAYQASCPPHPALNSCGMAAARSYVMRSAVAESGQLANADALGVEAEAFWCFASLMERMEANFCSDSR